VPCAILTLVVERQQINLKWIEGLGLLHLVIWPQAWAKSPGEERHLEAKQKLEETFIQGMNARLKC